MPFSILTVSSVAATPEVTFRAGAARIDITPAEDAALPLAGYGNRTMTGVHDPVHVRAVVMDDGATQAAVVVVEISGIASRMHDTLVPRIAEATGIPRDHILLAATHAHSAPGGGYAGGESSEPVIEWTRRRDASIVQAVQDAQRRLQPARVGFGSGQANVNMNRRARLANGGWWLGMNPDGPSDKTVAVVSFTNEQGHPIAILTNFAAHCTVMGPENLLVSSDLGGATSRFVEDHYGNEVVCLWTSGAAGDQRPLYSVVPGFNERAAERIGPVEVQGQMLGEETVRVADTIRPLAHAPIRAVQTVVSCPGKRNPPGPRFREDANYTFLDAGAVDVHLSVLMVGHIALTGVSGEAFTLLGQRLKQESPFSHTLMITHCNGSSGYLPDDAAYDHVSYEIVVSRVKAGCAENAVINGLLNLLEEM